jgi:hypothetical protein
MSSTHEDFEREHEVRRATNRKFGLVMAGAFAFVALAPMVSGKAMRLWAAPIAGVFLVLTLFVPHVLEPLNKLWFALGLLIGRITSPIFLAAFYFLVLTPLALLMRITGKDVLRLRRDGAAGSYWIPRTPPGPEPSTLRRQF